MPNKKGRKRRFGSIRKTPLGEFQASYIGPDGKRHFAPHRFKRERDADRWLAGMETVIISGDWTDPERAKVPLGDYAERWIKERPNLRPRTEALYRWLLTKHVAPYLGEVEVGRLSAAMIRQWRADRLAAGVSSSVMAKSYRFLRSVLNTAVEPDAIITRNPCRVPGADKETPGERPVLTVAQVFDLANRVPDRFKAMILLTAFASLRFGEVTALRRCDIGEDAGSVRVARAFVEVPGQGLLAGPPKSRAGVRTIIVPAAIRPEIVTHLGKYTGPADDALVFTGHNGGALRRPNFNQRSRWTKVVADMGLAGLHFHDLRHAGNIWASKAGMSTKDLMARMGHDDMRAALIYQRATSEADRMIADRLSDLVDKHRSGQGEGSETTE
ncbi:site-specific recombinase XerC [Prauserella shujinwangii]|uniref:Site-specific recombinase XerC n=1 Tax=Prauserella shujinwangii TaxID=1453103 RepID=A0A2T0LUN7_9PSEU|nr:site-specific integrase [Prauserella shujinwangii]PRX47560.1 site-specific recombinase XerC [Prauserella shujinwangii]